MQIRYIKKKYTHTHLFCADARANQPAGAIIRLQCIIGQSQRVIDNLIDCNLINKFK